MSPAVTHCYADCAARFLKKFLPLIMPRALWKWVAKLQVFESGKVPFLGLSTLGCYRDLYMPSSALLIKLYVLFWVLLRDQTAARRKAWSRYGFPRSKKKGDAKRSFLMMLTAGVKKVLEVKDWMPLKGFFFCVGFKFIYVIRKSMMCLRDKVGHSGEEIGDLG